jgi:hypothetical protein
MADDPPKPVAAAKTPKPPLQPATVQPRTDGRHYVIVDLPPGWRKELSGQVAHLHFGGFSHWLPIPEAPLLSRWQLEIPFDQDQLDKLLGPPRRGNTPKPIGTLRALDGTPREFTADFASDRSTEHGASKSGPPPARALSDIDRSSRDWLTSLSFNHSLWAGLAQLAMLAGGVAAVVYFLSASTVVPLLAVILVALALAWVIRRKSLPVATGATAAALAVTALLPSQGTLLDHLLNVDVGPLKVDGHISASPTTNHLVLSKTQADLLGNAAKTAEIVSDKLQTIAANTNTTMRTEARAEDKLAHLVQLLSRDSS